MSLIIYISFNFFLTENPKRTKKVEDSLPTSKDNINGDKLVN